MPFETELKKLGLKDKEAAVYLACLENGPSSVQHISRKAKVVRATTYVVLESLAQQGLVTHYKEGKKTLFSAEPPRQLMRLLERQREEVEEKERELEDLLPELQVLMKSAGDRPSIRYFSGKEGLHVMRQEIVMYCEPGDVIYNFTPTDHLDAVFADEEENFFRQREAKHIKSKTILTTRSSSRKSALFSAKNTKYAERRYVPPELFPSTSGLTIYGDRIAIGAFTGQLGGVVIESSAMAEMMRRMFELAWRGAKDLDKNHL